MAAASFGAQAGSAVGGAYEQYKRAQSDKNQAEMDARGAETEAAWIDNQGLDASRRGAARFMRLRMTQSQQVGAERARLAAHGGSLTEGSGARVISDMQFIGDIDAKTELSNTEKETWVIRQSARNKTLDAAMMRAAGRGISPTTRAVGSLISGAGKVAKAYYGYQDERDRNYPGVAGSSSGRGARTTQGQYNVFNRAYGDE